MHPTGSHVRFLDVYRPLSFAPPPCVRVVVASSWRVVCEEATTTLTQGEAIWFFTHRFEEWFKLNPYWDLV